MARWRSIAGVVLVLAGSAVAAEAASTRALTLFSIGVRDVSDEAFVVGTDDPGLIARARAELALPESERRLFPIGAVIAGHGGHNLGWSRHLDPNGWEVTESSVELCDGRPSHVEANLEAWLDEVGSYCPWDGYVLREGVVGPAADASRLRVRLELSLTGHAAPTSVTAAGDGSGRLFITEPFLDGAYLFTDFCTGRIWALERGRPRGWAVAEVGRTTFNVFAFGEDDAGEVFAIDLGQGALLRLAPDPALPAPRQGARRVAP